jgi:hypothetical protein
MWDPVESASALQPQVATPFPEMNQKEELLRHLTRGQSNG